MVELLIAATIGVIITSMLILVWIALTDSWNATARGSEARDFARDAVARLSRELRDMEPNVGQATAVTAAEPFRVRFSTTFNLAGNEDSAVAPMMTEYYYEQVTNDDGSWEGVLHWVRDTDRDGLDEADPDRVVARNLLNDPDAQDPDGDPTEALFTYTYIDAAADRQTDSSPSALDNVLIVTVRLIVDMQPGKAPLPMDLKSTVQLRNQQ